MKKVPKMVQNHPDKKIKEIEIKSLKKVMEESKQSFEDHLFEIHEKGKGFESFNL